MTSIPSEIMQEARDWALRLRGSAVGDQDRAAFDAWRAADPRHAAAHARLAALFATIRADGAEIGARLDTRKRTRSRRRGAAIVAAVALFALAGAGAYLTAPPSYQTEIGQQRQVALADGSRIELNTNTRLRVQFSDGTRRIIIERGEALFDVAHDPGRPFIVEANGRSVRAVGTQFAVRIDGGTMSVLVVEGVVAVREGQANPERLGAGERMLLAHASPLREAVPAAEIERNLAWRGGWVEFNGQPLAEVTAEMTRYTGVRFVIEDPALADLKVWAYIPADDLEPFIDTLVHNDPRIAIRREPGLVRIRLRDASN